jgi:hypothetical protein
MTECEAFEIAVEMGRHGALGDEERRGLAAHLSGCASCRAFQEASRRAEGVMAEWTGEALREADWERVEHGIRRRMAAQVTRLAAGATVSAVVMGALVLFEPPGQRLQALATVTPVVAGIWLAVMALAGWSAWRTARLSTRGEVLAYQRRTVARSLAILSRTRWLVAAFAALEASRALRAADARHAATLGFVAVCLGAIFVYSTLIRLPRLRRELTDLGTAEP